MSNVLTFDEIRLERVADTTLWGHGILRDEGIGGPVEAAGAGFMMRNFLVEALMLLGESGGLELDEPVFESVPVLSDDPARAGRVTSSSRARSAATIDGSRPTSVAADVSSRCGAAGSTSSPTATAWRGPRAWSSRAIRPSRRSSAATSSSTRIRRPARGRWRPSGR